MAKLTILPHCATTKASRAKGPNPQSSGHHSNATEAIRGRLQQVHHADNHSAAQAPPPKFCSGSSSSEVDVPAEASLDGLGEGHHSDMSSFNKLLADIV